MPDSSSALDAPNERTAVSLWTCLQLALAVGLLTSELELVVRWLRALPSHGMQLTIGPDGWWMGPLIYAVVFPGIAGAAWLSVRWLGAPTAARAAIVGAVAAGVAGLLFLFDQLHLFGVLMLAAGVGVQVSRWALRTPRKLEALARRALPAVAAMVFAAASVAVGGRAWGERRSLATLPSAEAGAPNVVLLILDTVRARSLHLYGYGRENTPALDSLARDGVLFEHAWATAPWTLPSHASIMTGRYPSELKTNLYAPLDATYPTLAEVLAGRGYRTGGFSANVYFASQAAGIGRGFSRFRDRGLTIGQAVLSTSLSTRVSRMERVRRVLGYHDDPGRVRADEVNRRFLSWLDAGTESRRPFFAFLNYMEAHEPYLPKAPYRGRFGPDTARKNWLIGHAGFGPGSRRYRDRMLPHELEAERAAYDESILSADAEIGRLVASLRSRGVWENTILVVTADHGEQFGRHGVFDHGNSLYRQLLEVPLLIVAPARVPAGTRVATPVSLRDLAATIVDLSGADSSALPGLSLASQWQGGGAVSPIYSELQNDDGKTSKTFRSLVLDGLHYVEPMKAAPQLYRIADDVDEDRDLAKDPAMWPSVIQLRSWLLGVSRKTSAGEVTLGER
ncbi:MAG: sulfatase [Gemmatimonadaceae bacterium]